MTVRRPLQSLHRPVPSIERIARTFRTLNPFERRWRPVMLREGHLDGVVTVTLARVRWIERPFP